MKKALALILSLLIVLALIPPVSADGATAAAMSAAPKDGDRVVIFCPNKSTVIGSEASGTKLVSAGVTLSDGQFGVPQTAAVFTVAKNGTGEYAFTVGGKYLTSGKNGSSLTLADSPSDYALWILEEVAGKGYLIRNKKAESNGAAQYIEEYNGLFTTFEYRLANQKFFLFQFYKVTDPEEISEPAANPSGGLIQKGTAVALSCATDGAKLFYGFDGKTFSAYTAPVAIDTDRTLYAYAEKNGRRSSVVSFAYSVYDGVMSIPQALTAGDVPSASVVGQLVYRFGNGGRINSAVLQTKIGGEIYALQVYHPMDYDSDGNPVAIGDWLVLTGTLGPYGGVQQMQNVTEIRKASQKEIIGEDASAPQVFECFADINDRFDSLITEYVLIKNVTLGAYQKDGFTTLTDSAGATMPLYRAAPYPAGIQAGDTVNLYCAVSQYGSERQLRNGSPKDYIPTNDHTPPTITRVSTTDSEAGRAYPFKVQVEDASGVSRVRADVFRGETQLAVIGEPDGVEDDIYTFVIPSSAITGSKLTVKITAADGWEPPNVASESFELTVVDFPQIVDYEPGANVATGDDKRPTISVTYLNCGTNPTVEMTLNGVAVSPNVGDRLAIYTPTEDLPDGRYNVFVKVTRQDGKSDSASWRFTVGEAQYQLYFGQLHAHTAEYSDGTGTLAQALEHAKNAPQIDFLAITDHSNCFDDGTRLGDLTDASKGINASGTGMTRWQKAKATAEAYADDTFIPIIGFEMTWSGQYGHMNTFNSIGVESRNNPQYTVKGGAGLVAYYDRLAEVARIDKANGRKTTISQFNHPGTVFGTFDDFAHYSPAYDELITMIEVGNGEGKVGSAMYFPSYEYYTMALDKGWHLAPTNNQDNHKGNWGDSNTCRTVVYTDTFSEEGICDAMRSMAMYATEDNDLEIYYTLNGRILGSILDLGSDETLHIRVEFRDPTDRVKTVSIVANGGKVVASKSFNANAGTWEIDLPNSCTYYYVRVDEVDTDVAVTAPVWTGETVRIGVSPVEKNTAVELKDEPITFTVPVYNYEEPAPGENPNAADFTVTKAVYSIDGKIVEIVTNPALGQGGNVLGGTRKDGGLEWTYTPFATGRFTLDVEVTGTFRGTEYTFRQSFGFTVRDSADMSRMLIDAGHDNFYITGKYPDSDAAFVALAAQHNVLAERITVPIDDAVLADCDLLVLTVPFEKDSCAGNYLYTDDEIAAIERYAARGGSFIVCSKSDRFDPETEAETASVISNRLLTAIGAKARIGKGIVSDAENMSNESFRLHFTGKDFYNWNNPLTEYLIENTNLMFACYNAAPVILNGAESVVNAYDTSFVSSYPLCYTQGNNVTADQVYQPYYDACGDQDRISVLAYETLPGGGFCITAGVTFFTTFEIKVDTENAATLQNTNHQIALNLFKLIHPDKVTPIADIHAAGKTNVPYTIEGYVTSNASGYDGDTAFFDCIYVQDDSGRGINVFPVSGRFEIGQKVRVTGMTGEYMGEIELNCGGDYGGEIRDVTLRDTEYTADGVTTTGYATRARLLDVAITMKNKQTVDTYTIDETALNAVLDGVCRQNRAADVEPVGDAAGTFLLEELTTAEASSRDKVGNLVSFHGRVTGVESDENGVIGAIRVDDGSGEVVIFLDGYINCDDGCEKDEQGYHDLSRVRTGELVIVRGIVSVGQNSYDRPDRIGMRIRVRNRADIVRIVPVYGDANCDGKVDSNDAADVLRALLGLTGLPPEGMHNADVSAEFDGVPNAADAAAILRRFLGLIDRFEAEKDN